LGALRLLARAAKGSMRDALSLTDQAIAFGGGALTEAGVRQMLGAVDRSHAVRLLDALGQSDGAALVQIADQLRDLGLSASGTLEEMADLLQQMAVEQAVPGALDSNDPDAPAVVRLAAVFAADEVQLAYSMCLHGRAELGLAPDEYSGLVMVLLRLLAFRPGGVPPAASPRSVESSTSTTPPSSAPSRAAPGPTSAALLATRSVAVSRPVVPVAAPAQPQAAVAAASLDRNEPPAWVNDPAPWEEEGISASVQSPASGLDALIPRTDTTPASAATPAPASVATPEGDRWAEVVQAMVEAGTVQALVRELAMQAQCVAIDEKSQPALWRLRVERETLRSAAHVEKLQMALGQLLSCPVRIEVQAGVAADNPAQRAQAEKERRQQEAEALVRNDPLVREVMSQFKSARIVPGSVRPLA
jgi:DNA polymerase-3 subunit gamma/tau